MMSLSQIWGFALLSTLPVAVGQTVQQEGALELCRRLVDESREVDRLLRTVSDRESGLAAAAELRGKMEFLQQGAGQLGQLPLESAESARRLEQLMRDMTHITQGYMPVVQRLVEVNAYGAEELLRLFQFYKMSAPGAAGAPQGADSLLVRCYNEWCDGIDDMLYLLRRVQDASMARKTVTGELATAAARVERIAAEAGELQSGLSPLQLESELLPAARLQRLREELRVEALRLQNAGYYGQPQLNDQLERCLRAAGL